MNIHDHVTTHGRYAAAIYCMRKARELSQTAARTLDATTAERARIEAAAWLDLRSLINAGV